MLGFIDENGEVTDAMVDGSKIISAVDNLDEHGGFSYCWVTLDANCEENMSFSVMESAMDIMKKIDECDRFNKR